MSQLAVSAVVLGAAFAAALSLGNRNFVPGFERRDTTHISLARVEAPEYTRETRTFAGAAGDRLEAWLYSPTEEPADGLSKALVIVAHGLGGQKDFGLEMYSRAYAQIGVASLAFDYRGFGGSQGEPRNLLMPSMQVEDWKDAFRYAKSLGYSQIVLHGTSYAGGHVVTVASQLGPDPALVGVISQVPYLGGPGGKKANIRRRGVLGIVRMVNLWIHDSFRGLFSLPPVGLKVTGEETDTLALMNLTPRAREQYFSKHPEDRLGGWQNFAAGRGLMDMLTYKPLKFVAQLPVRTLMVSVTDDELCPLSDMELAKEASNGKIELFVVQGAHFDVYYGEGRDQTLSKYKSFVAEVLQR